MYRESNAYKKFFLNHTIFRNLVVILEQTTRKVKFNTNFCSLARNKEVAQYSAIFIEIAVKRSTLTYHMQLQKQSSLLTVTVVFTWPVLTMHQLYLFLEGEMRYSQSVVLLVHAAKQLKS